jgi:plastocyanin
MMLQRLGLPLRLVRRHVRLAAGVIAVGALAVALGGQAGVGDAAAGGRTVRSQGGNSFVANAKIMSTLKFAPGPITIASGEVLTFEHADKTEEPHTLSIVDEAEVPGTEDDVFNCGAPGTVCDDVFSAFPGEPSASVFVDAAGTGAGIDGRLDSLFVLPGDSVSAPVTAAPGTDLYYICAIHAWMQGVIHVR